MLKFQFLDFVSEEMKNRHNSLYPDIPQTCSSLSDYIDVTQVDLNILEKQLDMVRRVRPNSIKKVQFKPPLHSRTELAEYFNPAGEIIKGLDKCLTPWLALAINTNGKVFWHIRCFNDYILGDVNLENLQQIFYGQKAESFRKQLQDCKFCFPACSRCCGVMEME